MAGPGRSCQDRPTLTEPTQQPPPVLDDFDGSLAAWTKVARSITRGGMWCVFEVRSDPGDERWEPVLMLCTEDGSIISTELAAAITDHPRSDVRVAGYTRDTLRRVERAPAATCYRGSARPLPDAG